MRGWCVQTFDGEYIFIVNAPFYEQSVAADMLEFCEVDSVLNSFEINRYNVSI
jgi:hypothetical protein